MRKIFVMFLIAAAMAVSAIAADGQWLSLTGATQGAADVRVARSDWNQISLNVQIPGLLATGMETKGGEFTRLEIPGGTLRGNVGEPQLPALHRFVDVPFGAAIELSISAGEPQVIELDEFGFAQVYPAQPPIPKLPGAIERAEFVIKRDVYAKAGMSQQPLAWIRDDGALRGHRLISLEINPVHYDAAANTLLCYSDINVSLRFDGADIEGTIAQWQRYASAAFDQLLTDLPANSAWPKTYVFPPDAPPAMLIICADAYLTAINPWVEWKTATGFDVTVTPTSVAGSTSAAIRTYITNAYTTWPNPPSFVLLVGDTDTIPHFTGSSSGSADDMPYTDLDGGGYWTPDVMLGRWPVRNASDVAGNVTKSLEFEQMTMASNMYFKDSLWLASSDHSSMLEATHLWCFNNHVDVFDPSNNTMHQVYERLGGDTVDFASNVNSGRGIVCYSGHGYGDGSGTASVHFVQSDVRALTNNHLFGHVMVFACGTNLHDQTESFGEIWVNEENKGSVTYWGTSDSSYWDEDDWEQREIYRTMHEDGYWAIAAPLFAGLMEVYVQSPGSAAYYFNIYNLMGDPSLPFHARIPQVPVISCAETTPPVPQEFVVTVTAGGTPVEFALVSAVLDGELLGSGYTNASGVVELAIEPLVPGTMTIQVTSANLMPTSRDILVLAGGCGAVILSSDLYNCSSLVNVLLFDSDLNVNPSGIDTAQVRMSSTQEPSGELITMTETAPDSAQFTGSIQLSSTQGGPGYLLVANNSTVTATYNDADCEGVPTTVTDTALTDCIGPAISNTAFSGVDENSAFINWTTDQESSTTVLYGISTPPALQMTNPGLRTSHSVELEDLDSCQTYYFAVSSTDPAGNTTVDNNGGAYYSFTTLGRVLMLDETMDTNPNWTISGGQWAWGQPTGSGGDPSSGHTGSNVYGYNLAGQYGNSIPEYFLTTPPLDCSAALGTTLTFYRWLGVESATWDHARVRISTDGTNWTLLWENGGTSMSETDWAYCEYDISAYADGHSTVYIRWVMGPTDSSVTYCGWNIDDVQVSYVAPCNAPNLAHQSHQIDDCMGNQDGVIDYGEPINMPVTLVNHGVEAIDVSGTLTSNSPFITIEQAASEFGDIPAGGTATSAAPFQFTVATDAPDGTTVQFTLTWTCQGHNGSISFSEMIHRPALATGAVTVHDSELGDGDGVLDPGETARVQVNLANAGSGQADSLTARLVCDQPQYVTVLEATGSYPNVPAGESAAPNEPFFLVSAASTVPDPTTVGFTVEVAGRADYSADCDFAVEITASTFTRRYYWDMETNPGWTGTGDWAWGMATGQCGDPNGVNVYGYNLAGCYPNNMNAETLITSAIDCSNLSEVQLMFDRWLGVESNYYDYAGVHVSNDGSNWNLLWENSASSFQDTTWTGMEFDISAVADGEPTVFVRWTMGDSDGSVTYSGWNIDEVEIWGATSGTPPTATPTRTPTYTPVPPTPTPTEIPTEIPPTEIPPTEVPPTEIPPTEIPPTEIPPTEIPPTEIPPTEIPPTETAVPPTNTPVPPTNTPVPPTDTPVPPTETPEPTPGDIICDLILNQTLFHPNDTFLLECRKVNPGPVVTVEHYILLEVLGQFWFWPSWTQDLDFQLADLPPASDETEEILTFTWPTGAGSFDGIRFWAAYLAPSSATIVGLYDMVEWGYAE